jgi:hypothetical protein
MDVYIQSKSGDFNSSVGLPVNSLASALVFLRTLGSYAAEFKGSLFEVPFEEIQYIRELKADE